MGALEAIACMGTTASNNMSCRVRYKEEAITEAITANNDIKESQKKKKKQSSSPLGA